MKNLRSNKNNESLAIKYKSYFKGIVSVYPDFMTSILKKPNNTYFLDKINEGAQMSKEEILNLSKIYNDELKKYKAKAYAIAFWLGVPSHTFYLDSIGTDIMESIMSIPEEYFQKVNIECEKMTPEQSTQYKQSKALAVVQMSEKELDDYKKNAIDELIK